MYADDRGTLVRCMVMLAGVSALVWMGGSYAITASFGIAVNSGADDTAAIFKRADQAAYRAKASGRNCVCWQTERVLK